IERSAVTRLLVLVNVLAFAYEILTTHGGILSGNVTNIALVNDGALVPFLVTQDGQWWRIISSAFLHASIIHIGVNMISLFSLGRFIETELGSLRMTAIYAVSLVCAGLGAVYFSVPNVPTLGASGAIFGLFGALFAIGLKLGKPGMALIKANIPLLVINLVLTFSVPMISKQEHLAGLFAGFILTLLLFWPPKPVRARVVDARTGDEIESHFEA
ncbi:MAG: rhomboid family intramembrane serine protease, partial [Candidatus Eremiobacteraeota bacterium]|nr:rhomboid family intramembrane serine protease [Candidatus Eremiobacteraeota bacterium]